MGGSDAESRSKFGPREESKTQSLSSSSARRPSPSQEKKHERSSEKKKMKRRSHSSSSSSSSSGSPSREKKAMKKKKRREVKKLKREKKKEKKEKKRQKKLAVKAERAAAAASVPVPVPVPDETLQPSLPIWQNEEAKEQGPVMTEEQKASFCTKRPMTKEEYDAKQSIIRRVVDPETGRTRLIRGDGEVLEEIVTKERHKDINKQATKGDGDAFQKRLGINR